MIDAALTVISPSKPSRLSVDQGRVWPLDEPGLQIRAKGDHAEAEVAEEVGDSNSRGPRGLRRVRVTKLARPILAHPGPRIGGRALRPLRAGFLASRPRTLPGPRAVFRLSRRRKQGADKPEEPARSTRDRPKAKKLLTGVEN
jgi:hypothetical protein